MNICRCTPPQWMVLGQCMRCGGQVPQTPAHTEKPAMKASIFDRMTPEAIAGVLENIAEDIKADQNTVTELDVTHLRQIADWLETRQKGSKHNE